MFVRKTMKCFHYCWCYELKSRFVVRQCFDLLFFRIFPTYKVFLNRKPYSLLPPQSSNVLHLCLTKSIIFHILSQFLSLSLQRFLDLHFLFLFSGCQFISDLGNLLLSTCQIHLNLLPFIFYIIFLLKFNWYLISFSSFFPIPKFLTL